MILYRRYFFLLALAFLLALIAAIVIPTPLFAQPDLDAPVYIYADNAEIDEDAGLSIYSGNVRVEQENIELLADRITVNFSGELVEHVFVTGSPAQYRERDANGVYLFSTGKEIEYSAAKNHVILSGNAQISQKGDQLRGELLTYTLADKVLTASGQSAGRRVQNILRPSTVLLEKSSQGDEN
ncbi:MAG: lipopolysaccharide transport periplasmic protein LptA [Gammaproteobacteria bacterium]|nr:MAG: lipopolysaccharide transport periplasmic protein LptA [Gammaproteobacteria bacterium]